MSYWLLAIAILIAGNWLASALVESADKLNDTIERLIFELIAEEDED
ncbi:hypothetical protein I6F34_01100 [Bradyrhizobium sp. BRP05]|nr:hypothetical protein [Bradyrhizobium sp. BRP05]